MSRYDKIGIILLGIFISICFMTLIYDGSQAAIVGYKVTGEIPKIGLKFRDKVVTYGSFFCISNDNDGSICVTARHVTNIEDVLTEAEAKIDKIDLIVEENGVHYLCKLISSCEDNDIAMFRVYGKQFQALRLVDDSQYPIGTELIMDTEIYGICQYVVAYGRITSDLANIDGEIYRICDVDVMHGCSGSAIRLVDEPTVVIGMVTGEFTDNGFTIFVPSREIMKFVYGKEK